MRLIPELPNTRESRRIAYRAMHLIAEANLAAGRDVIVNACYGHAEDRLAAEDLARRCGARLYLVEFHVPLEVALERAAARLGSHPGSDLTPGRVRMLVSKFPYSGAGLAVDSTASPEACLAAIEAYLTSHTSPPNPGAGA